MKRLRAISKISANELQPGDVVILHSFFGSKFTNLGEELSFVVSVDLTETVAPLNKTRQWQPAVSSTVITQGIIDTFTSYAKWNRDRIERVWQRNISLISRNGMTAKEVKQAIKMMKEQERFELVAK